MGERTLSKLFQLDMTWGWVIRRVVGAWLFSHELIYSNSREDMRIFIDELKD